jgi:hypothetical protein
VGGNFINNPSSFIIHLLPFLVTIFPFLELGVCWHRGRPRVQRTNKTLTIGPFGNTFESGEVSLEVEAGGRYMTHVSLTKMGHIYVITTLRRVLRNNVY